MSETTDAPNAKNLSHRPHRQRQASTSFRWFLRRGRPRQPTIRLGGKKPRGGFFLTRLCKKAKVKWMKMEHLCMLKKLKKFYKSLVKDIIEGSATIESFQQRLLLETSFAVPVMGLSFNTFP